jgi:hypothetical protein
LRMIALLERNAPRTAKGSYGNWCFYLDGVDFIRNYGSAMIDMTSMQAYLKSLLGNEAVTKYLQEFHGPIHDKFKEIDELDFFRLKNMG